jgi:excisionase family DNA binding protein
MNAVRILKSGEVAKMLRAGQRTVCYWAECEMIPGFKVGRQWRFREDLILTLLKTQWTGDLKMREAGQDKER